MGNICSTNKGGGGRPPRDLTDLLEDMMTGEVTENSDLKENKDGRAGSPWGLTFRLFLLQRKQEDIISCLDFVLDCERLRALGEEEEASGPNKKRAEEIRLMKLRLLQSMGQTYFSTDSKSCLPLSNQVVQEEASMLLTTLTPDQVEEAMSLVWLARGDSQVWRNGLDAAYKSFLATHPSSTIRAVILSIL